MKNALRLARLVTGIVLCATMMPASAKRLALVIGNDNYQSVSKLQKAGNDAVAMASELRSAGFEVGLYRDLNYREMVKATEELYNRVQGGDEVVIFFAGHGVQIKSGNYLLPVDIEPSTESMVEKTSYSLNDMNERLESTRAAFSLVIVDACRDNPLKAKGRAVGGERGLSPPDPPKGQMVVYSASRGEQALDRLGESDADPNGVFTREFIKRMRKPGVKVEELVREVQISVEKLAYTVGHKQRPALYNEVRGNFYFFGPVAVMQPSVTAVAAVDISESQREDRFWEDTKAAGNLDGFEAYLEQYPKGRYARLSRANIERLKVPPTSASVAASSNSLPSVAEVKTPTTNAPPATARNNNEVPVKVEAAVTTAPPTYVKPDAMSQTTSQSTSTLPANSLLKAPTRTNGPVKLPNGDRYDGDLDGIIRNGKGTYLFLNGNRYVGEFSQDLFHGKGTQTFTSGDVYSGDFESGNMNGTGTYSFANGDRFEGTFVEGIFSGKGVIIFRNGDRYEGAIAKGVRHGIGTQYFVTKDRYEGSFAFGLQSGKGTHYFANGDKYEGLFSKGIRDGQGKYLFASGQSIEQTFVNGAEKK